MRNSKQEASAAQTSVPPSNLRKPPMHVAPIRISQADCLLIGAGLNYFAGNLEIWSAKGRLPYAHPELRWQPRRFDRGCYSTDFMQQVLSAGQAVSQILDHGGRLYDLSVFQIAALILAVRVVTQNVRHGHFKSQFRTPPDL
jgi:hypothetical protein